MKNLFERKICLRAIKSGIKQRVGAILKQKLSFFCLFRSSSIVAGELNHRKGNLLAGLNHCPDLGLGAHTGKSNDDYQEQRARDT